MRSLLVLLVFLNLSFSQDYVLICQSESAYAFHKSLCSGLKQCRHTVEKVSKQDAIRMGRRACQICYAGALIPSGGIVSSGQCNATTKKGTRCSRSVRSGNYCWQHGG